MNQQGERNERYDWSPSPVLPPVVPLAVVPPVVILAVRKGGRVQGKGLRGKGTKERLQGKGYKGKGLGERVQGKGFRGEGSRERA